VVDRSIVVYRRVRGLYRVSEKKSEVLKEGMVGVGVQGLRIGVRVGGSVQVCICVYNFW